MFAEAQSDPSSLETRRAAFAGWLSETNEVTRTFLAASAVPGLINLAGGLPASELLPAEEAAAMAARAIAENPEQALGYGAIEGLPALRDAIAERFSAPSLRLTRDNVLVTTSGMQGLDLVGKVLLDRGDLISGQFPTYLGALDAWRPRAPQYRNMDVFAADFDATAALRGAKFAYTAPNFSNPTGRLVCASGRQALIDAAVTTGAWLVEDDPYGGLAYDGPIPPRMLEMSATGERNAGERRAEPGPYEGPVIYLGTVSKEMAPGLRIGWMIGAPAFIEAATIAKQGSDMCTSGVTQQLALEALRSGLVDALQPKLVALYRARRDALCAAMEEHLSDWFVWERPVGGMFVWARAKDPSLNTDALMRYGIDNGVAVSPSSVFDATGAHRSAIRVNFTYNEADKLAEGVRRLAAAVRAMLSAGD